VSLGRAVLAAVSMTSNRGRNGRPPVLVVLRALGLGDFLTAVPALRALARAFPDHTRVLATPEPLRPLAALCGGIDAIADTRSLGVIDPCLRGADVAVNLHGRGPESHRTLLSLSPHRLIAFSPPDVPATAGAPPWRAREHEVERWCRLLREAGIAADPRRLDLPRPHASPPAEATGATIIHPGASHPARRWPPQRWAQVARAERLAGRRVLVTGDDTEIGLANEVRDGAGLEPAAVLAGRTDLQALAALVGAAGRVASADTGMAHLATALGTPSVVLFGPASPSEWGPPPDRPRHIALSPPTIPGGIDGIPVADVLGALNRLR